MAVRVWLAVALVATAPATVSAQPRTLPVYADATIREWQPEFRDVVHDNYKRMVAPQLSPVEAERLRTLRWEFPADPARVLFDFYTRGDGAVFLPVASLLLLKDVAAAEAWLTVNGYSSQAVLDYLSVIRMDRLGQWPVRERLPLAALGVPANASDNPRVLERRNENLSKSVLFIMGHELGHLVHGLDAQAACAGPAGDARPAGCDLAALQRSEAAADAFAVELFRRMGLVPSASNFFFVMSSRLHKLPFEFSSDAQWQAYAKAQTHPLDSARVAHVAALIKADRTAFASLLSPATGGARVDGLVDELRRLAQLLNDRNLGGLQVAWGKTVEPQDLKPRRSITPTLRPEAADLAASAAFIGYFRGELRPQGTGDNRQPLEVLFRVGSGSILVGEAMLMGIRGRLDGQIDPPRRALLTLDIGGDLYDMTLETATDGRAVAGVYQSRTDRSATGRLQLTRSATPP